MTTSANERSERTRFHESLELRARLDSVEQNSKQAAQGFNSLSSRPPIGAQMRVGEILLVVANFIFRVTQVSLINRLKNSLRLVQRSSC